jgi:hypothetical protein
MEIQQPTGPMPEQSHVQQEYEQSKVLAIPFDNTDALRAAFLWRMQFTPYADTVA